MGGDEVDLINRDPNNINSNIQVSLADIRSVI